MSLDCPLCAPCFPLCLCLGARSVVICGVVSYLSNLEIFHVFIPFYWTLPKFLHVWMVVEDGAGVGLGGALYADTVSVPSKRPKMYV